MQDFFMTFQHQCPKSGLFRTRGNPCAMNQLQPTSTVLNRFLQIILQARQQINRLLEFIVFITNSKSILSLLSSAKML